MYEKFNEILINLRKRSIVPVFLLLIFTSILDKNFWDKFIPSLISKLPVLILISLVLSIIIVVIDYLTKKGGAKNENKKN